MLIVLLLTVVVKLYQTDPNKVILKTQPRAGFINSLPKSNLEGFNTDK